MQSETPTVVPTNYVQIENGIYGERGISFGDQLGGTSRTDQLNYNLLVKYGIVRNLELRYNIDYIHNDFYYGDEEVGSIGGLGGPYLGLKYSFLQDDGSKPNLTLSAHSRFDWYGREEFQNENNNLNMRLTCGKSFTDNWYGIVGYELQFQQNSTTTHFYVVQTGYSFNKLTVIAELYGLRNYSIDQNNNAFNGALVYLLNSNHQVDLSAGKGLGDNWYDSYWAVGYSFRFSP